MKMEYIPWRVLQRNCFDWRVYVTRRVHSQSDLYRRGLKFNESSIPALLFFVSLAFVGAYGIKRNCKTFYFDVTELQATYFHNFQIMLSIYFLISGSVITTGGNGENKFGLFDHLAILKKIFN